MILSKYYREKQKNMRWGGVHLKKQNGRQRGILLFTHLPHSGEKKIMVTYLLITLKNNQRRSLIFKWVQNLESTSSGMGYMH
jgi:hypothetical protein